MQLYDQELNVLLLVIQRFEDPVRLSFVKSHSEEHGNERVSRLSFPKISHFRQISTHRLVELGKSTGRRG